MNVLKVFESRVFRVVVLGLALVFATSGFILADGTGLELPPELTQAITVAVGGAIVWAVTSGIKGLVEAFGGDMSGQWGKVAQVLAATISAGVVGTLIGVINNGLAFIPEQFIPLAQSILALLVTVFSAMGVQRANKKKLEAQAGLGGPVFIFEETEESGGAG